MPAVIDPAKCNRNWDQCFPARICPESAFSLTSTNDVTINSELCGDCPGPCVNFCDGYAIHFDHDPDSFEITKSQLLEGLTEAEALGARQALKQEKEAAIAASSAVLDVTLGSFIDDVINSELPVIVDFWAPWCGPCKAMSPVFEELAREHQARVKFVKVNTEEEHQLAAQFRIASIPTLMVFQHGQIVDGAVGALSRPQLETLINRMLPDESTSGIADDGPLA